MDTALNRLRARIENIRVFASSRSRRRFIVHLLALGLVFVVVTVLVQRHFGFLTDAQALREFIRGYGALLKMRYGSRIICSIENAVRESDHSVLESFLMLLSANRRTISRNWRYQNRERRAVLRSLDRRVGRF